MRRFPVAFVVLVILASTLVPAAAVAAPVVPDTPIGRQVSWLVDVSHRLPLPADEAAQHFTAEVLAVLPVGDLNAMLMRLAGRTGLRLVAYDGTDTSAKTVLEGGEQTWLFDLSVNEAGLIGGFIFRTPTPSSWREVDARLRRIAPDVSLLAAEVTRGGSCRPVHALAASRARPLGSAFKLYVLGALAEAVRSGRASWDEPLAIHDEWKSLPSGIMQTLPAGTTFPLSTYADRMISISDNTATDHLIHRLGREEVERQERVRGRIPRHGRCSMTSPLGTWRSTGRYCLVAMCCATSSNENG